MAADRAGKKTKIQSSGWLGDTLAGGKSSKSAKRIPLLAPKSHLRVEIRTMLIFDESAPRLSEPYKFEFQGAKRTPF